MAVSYLLNVAAAGLLCCSANAAHSGQAWADARLERHLGPVNTALQRGDDLFVLTDAAVVAAQRLKTGIVTWRYVAAEDERLLDVAITSDVTFSISVRDSSGSVVRSRSETGAIRWEALLQSSPLEDAAGPALAAHNYVLAAVSGSTLSALELSSGRTLASIPATSGESFVSVAWSASGTLFGVSLVRKLEAQGSGVASAQAGAVHVWDEGEKPQVVPLAFSDPILFSSAGLIAGRATSSTVLIAASASRKSIQATCVAGGGAQQGGERLPSSTASTTWSLSTLAQHAGAVLESGAAVRNFNLIRDTSSEKSEWTLASVELSTGAVLYLRVTAGLECSEAARGVFYTPGSSAASACTVGQQTFALITRSNGEGDQSDAVVVDVAGKRVEERLSLPAVASAAASHGALWRVFAFAFQRAEAGSGVGWRVLSVHADGFTHMSKTGAGAALWSADEGSACAVHGLVLDIAPRTRADDQTGSDGNSRNENGLADAALALQARLKAQVALLQTSVKGAIVGTIRFAKDVTADPIPTLLGVLGLRGVPVRGVAMQPFVRTGVEHVIVARTRLDGGWAGCMPRDGSRRMSVHGSLSAKMVVDGQALWTLPLPIGAGSGRHAQTMPEEWVTVTVATRSHPIRGHGSEVLLVESGPLEGPRSRTFGVWITSIDISTGRVTGASYYTAQSPLERVARTPVVHASTQRVVHLLVHAGGEAVAVPGTKDVQTSLAGLGQDFVMAVPTYEPKGDDEGVAGLSLVGGTAAFAGGAAAVGIADYEAAQDGILIPLAFARVAAVWSHGLAKGSAGERLLALHLVGGDTPVLSAHVQTTQGKSNRGLKLENDLLQSAAAADSADSDSETAAEAGAGPNAPMSPVTVLGDDSLLIKFSLTRSFVVAVGQPSPYAASRSGFDKARERARAHMRVRAQLQPSVSTSAGALHGAGNLTVHLLSVASGRILHSRRTEGASGPVGIAVADNWAAYSYWNAARARPELGVLATYEGALDKNALTPWSTATSAAAVRLSPATVSAHTAPAPVVVHRSFLLPVTLKPGSLAVTRSHHRISTPTLVLGTSSEGIVLFDKKLFEPRRPNAEAVREADKAEGLLPYTPSLPFRHSWLLTHADKVARLHALSTAPSGLESTSLVLGLGVDTFVARAAPARAWDALDRDFNASLFVVLLAAMGVVTLVLGRMVKARSLQDAWK